MAKSGKISHDRAKLNIFVNLKLYAMFNMILKIMGHTIDQSD